MSSKTKSDLNPRTTSYEFLGPPGALFITLAVPLTLYGLYFGCSEQSGGCPPPNFSTYPDRISLALSDPQWWKGLWDTKATAIYFAWYAFCVVAWAILPGAEIEGSTMRNGQKKKYKINGVCVSTYLPFILGLKKDSPIALSTFLLALGITSGIIYNYGPGAFTFLYERWIGFVTASILMATLQAIGVYAMSFQEGKLLAVGGNSGNFIYDVRFVLLFHDNTLKYVV
jgi:Delta14-sterol reductase